MSNSRGFVVQSLWYSPGITRSLFHYPVLNNSSYPHIVKFFTNYPQAVHRLYPHIVKFFTSINRCFSTVSTGPTTISTTLNKLINSFRKAG